MLPPVVVDLSSESNVKHISFAIHLKHMSTRETSLPVQTSLESLSAHLDALEVERSKVLAQLQALIVNKFDKYQGEFTVQKAAIETRNKSVVSTARTLGLRTQQPPLHRNAENSDTGRIRFEHAHSQSVAVLACSVFFNRALLSPDDATLRFDCCSRSFALLISLAPSLSRRPLDPLCSPFGFQRSYAKCHNDYAAAKKNGDPAKIEAVRSRLASEEQFMRSSEDTLNALLGKFELSRVAEMKEFLGRYIQNEIYMHAKAIEHLTACYGEVAKIDPETEKAVRMQQPTHTPSMRVSRTL